MYITLLEHGLNSVKYRNDYKNRGDQLIHFKTWYHFRKNFYQLLRNEKRNLKSVGWLHPPKD